MPKGKIGLSGFSESRKMQDRSASHSQATTKSRKKASPKAAPKKRAVAGAMTKPTAKNQSLGTKAKSPVPAVKKSSPRPPKKQSFGAAFKAARAKGAGTTFSYGGKSYSAVTKDDLSKSGHKSLRSYLNASRKKK